MKNLTRKFFATLLCALVAATAMAAEKPAALIKKLKKAPGVEIVYKSTYKGNPRGQMAMKVVGTEVALQRVLPSGEAAEAGILHTAAAPAST